MDHLYSLAANYYENSDADQVAIAVIDFNKGNFDFLELGSNKIFDYASLTKPLINSFNHIKHKIDDDEMELLLNHRAGLPIWGRLQKKNWKEYISSFEIKESKTEYSDFSALRYLIELEKRFSVNAKEILQELEGIFFWLDKEDEYEVHDINSLNLREFTSHAGLFGSIEALAKALISFNQNYDFIEQVKKKMQKASGRFELGFDTVEDLDNTLAGKGCSKFTFGHLGFTGTSFWIDADKKRGHIILTNTTKDYWYNKKNLNQFRKDLGATVWQD